MRSITRPFGHRACTASYSSFVPNRARDPLPVLLHDVLSTQTRSHGHRHSGEHGSVQITFKSRKNGSEKEVEAFIGDNLLRCAQSHGIDLEGACECSIACSTCHVILDDDTFDSLPEATEEEDDMLDMAFELSPTSRLGCQVIITEDMDGIVVELPSATRNMYVDGHVPQPH